MIRLRFAFEGLPASYVIRFQTYGFVASHVEAVTPLGEYLGSRYPDGVKVRPAGVDNWPWEIFVDLPCTANQENAFWEWAQSTVGNSYDMADLLANFVLHRNWRQPGSWWCSEWAAFGLEKCGWFRVPLASRLSHVTPRDLALAISANGVQCDF